MSITRQGGASLVEFSIVALSVVFVGLFTLQIGLLYHAKTTLNYATFEAGRVGAVNNARISSMRTELGIRLAPLQGGDGSRGSALAAIAKSSVQVFDPLNTKITIINPTRAAFRDWAVQDPTTGKRFIPVNRLRHQTNEVGKHSGLTLRDANLLKVQVTHGVKLGVPVVGKLMTRAMLFLDADNAVFYLRGNWPIQSFATVRMQSDSLESEVLKSVSNETGGGSGSGSGNGGREGVNNQQPDEGNSVVVDSDGTGDAAGGIESGLASSGGTGGGESVGDDEVAVSGSDSELIALELPEFGGSSTTDESATSDAPILAGDPCVPDRRMRKESSVLHSDATLMNTSTFREMQASAKF